MKRIHFSSTLMKWDFGKRHWEADKSKVEVVMDWMSFELLEFSLDELVKDILKAIMNGALRAVIISILSSPLLQHVLLAVVTPLSYCFPLTTWENG